MKRYSDDQLHDDEITSEEQHQMDMDNDVEDEWFRDPYEDEDDCSDDFCWDD